MQEVNSFFDVFVKYIDGNIFYILSVIGLILYILGCKKNERKTLVLYVGILLVVAFNPLSYHILKKVTDEAMTYYRLIWVFPVTIFFAYSLYMLISKLKNKYYQLFVAVVVALGIIIYSVDISDLTLPDNKWQIPDYTLEVADSLEKLFDKEGVSGAVVLTDYETANTIRQYTARVWLPCSPRNLDINSTSETIEGVMAMIIDNRDDISSEAVDNILKTYGVRYIVVNISHGTSISFLKDLGWKIIDQTSDYFIMESVF